MSFSKLGLVLSGPSLSIKSVSVCAIPASENQHIYYLISDLIFKGIFKETNKWDKNFKTQKVKKSRAGTDYSIVYQICDLRKLERSLHY